MFLSIFFRNVSVKKLFCGILLKKVAIVSFLVKIFVAAHCGQGRVLQVRSGDIHLRKGFAGRICTCGALLVTMQCNGSGKGGRSKSQDCRRNTAVRCF